MKWKEEIITNRSVYNKLYKCQFASCSYCKWNRGENSNRHYRSMRSWKRFRKNQYKDIITSKSTGLEVM